MRPTGLIPARFLTLTSHLVILITVLLSRKENVLACLPQKYTQVEYNLRDGEFSGGLIAGLVLIAVELFGFFLGLSTFATTASVISTFCHSGGSVALGYMILHSWDCHLYWWIFSLASVIPAVLEIGVIVGILICKKNV